MNQLEMLDFTRDDYPPTERQQRQAEDEADLAPETAAYRRWCRTVNTGEEEGGE